MKNLSSHCLILVLILSYQCSPNQLKEHCNLLVDNDNETLSTLKNQQSEQLLCRCVSAQYNVLYLVCKELSLNSCHWKWACGTVLCKKCCLDLWTVHKVLQTVHECSLADYLWHKFYSMHKPINCMMIYYVSKFCSLVHELFCELCCNYYVVHHYSWSCLWLCS